MGRANGGIDRRKIGRNWESRQLEVGATRSRIEDDWHPNWEGARRKEKICDAGFEKIEDFNVPSNAEEKFCGSDGRARFQAQYHAPARRKGKERKNDAYTRGL